MLAAAPARCGLLGSDAVAGRRASRRSCMFIRLDRNVTYCPDTPSSRAAFAWRKASATSCAYPRPWWQKEPHAETPEQSERRKFVDLNRTPAGGWTRAFLASIGVPWPPPRGWRRHYIKTGEPWPYASGFGSVASSSSISSFPKPCDSGFRPERGLGSPEGEPDGTGRKPSCQGSAHGRPAEPAGRSPDASGSGALQIEPQDRLTYEDETAL